MKIEKFLNWIQDKLLNYPDLDFKAIKMFVDKFYYFLSKKEKERWLLKYQLISEFSSKQISLESFVHNSKVDNLENDLNNLKKE